MSRDQKKAESRKRILEAARDVFFRDGFMSANPVSYTHLTLPTKA